MEPIIKITPFKKKPNMDCQIFCFDTYEPERQYRRKKDVK